MATFLTPINNFVIKELENRRLRTLNQNPQNADIIAMYGKTPWVKMQSNAWFVDPHNSSKDASKDKNKISKTLYSAWLNSGNLAEFAGVYGNAELKPWPGITELDSTIKGTLGIMREVTVKFKVYTQAQLELMQDLFMIPGIGVLVEWGWSDVSPTHSSIYLGGISDDTNDRWLAKRIQDNIKKGGGLYDALFGLISDFGITFADDGTWDCSTTIVGPGAMTVDVNLKSPGNALDKQLIQHAAEQVNLELNSKSGNTSGTNFARCASFHGMSTDAQAVPTAEQPTDKTKQQQINEAFIVKTNVYVTWEFVEKMFNDFFQKVAGQNFAGSPTGKSATNETFLNSYVAGAQANIIPCNLFYDPQGLGDVWRSYNPTDVLIPGHPGSLTFDSQQKNVSWPAGTTPRAFDVKGYEKQYGDLAAVWMNFDTVVKPSLENSETIQEAINKVLNKLNDSAGGLWDLQLMYNNENFSQYRVVDMKCTYGLSSTPDKKNAVYAFDVNVKSGIVRNAEVSMVVPNALKATVMIAANGSDSVDSGVADRDKVGIFKSLSRGVQDRFARKRVVPGGSTGLTQQQFDILKEAASVGWNEDMTGDQRSAAINYIYTTIETHKSSIEVSALIPLELNLTIDGVGGLLWGNAFTIVSSALPKKYAENAVFQIIDISHSVTNDAWTTTIKGLMRPKYNGKAVSPDIQVGSPTQSSPAPIVASGKDKLTEEQKQQVDDAAKEAVLRSALQNNALGSGAGDVVVKVFEKLF